ncbi:MAG: RluA family pseudouridine synthase [Candidatus Pacebacteria bacterium]|nr:RluA family pseudouridine synthase [Candidatus Paceibacterota bacterium]
MLNNPVLQQLEIIYQDQDLLIINKPAGLVVNRAQTVKQATLQDWLAARQDKQLPAEQWQDLVPGDFNKQYGSAEEIFAQRQGLVHRLDKDTSGVMVAAKNPGSLVNLLAQFKKRQVKKAYLALVHGRLQLKQGKINLPLSRTRTSPHQFAVAADGRPAQTSYEVLQEFTKLDLQIPAKLKKYQRTYQAGFSLVKCWPQTGRTHQIRVHFKHLQHPLVGDQHYAGRKRIKLDKLWCPRQFLHAQELCLMRPRNHKQQCFQAALTDDLQVVLKRLRGEGG